MKTIIDKILKDATFLTGIGLIILSFFIFLLPDMKWAGTGFDFSFAVFIANYLLSIVYFGILWFTKIKFLYKEDVKSSLEYGFLHLILCLISAYSLNRQIPIFEKSTPWLQIVLCVQAVVLILLFLKNHFSSWFQNLLFAMLGIGFMLFLYLSIYLIPVYPLGLVAFMVLGISLHAIIPLLFTGTILLYIFREDNRQKRLLTSFSAGIAFSIIVIIYFSVRWYDVNAVITKTTDQNILDEKTDFPAWVYVAQKLPQSPITEKLLKTGVVYSQSSEFGEWRFFDFPSRNFEEARKHDPLVMIASFVCRRPDLGTDDRIKILESMYDSRHHAQERLWSAEDLETSHILTNVRIFPSLRIAYTEKIVSVRNNDVRQSWWNEEEAIYTFHLPEGAVVTSLSLWMNGKEEKAVLSAKNKADSAYKSVVGYERRDPSLVRWQEGNTVSVCVFPCTPKEDRRFKIGITSPLTKTAEDLTYQNIWFDGPSVLHANETVRLELMDNVKVLNLPSGFQQTKSKSFSYEGGYTPDWELSLQCPPVLTNNFSFDGNSYSIEEYHPAYQTFNPENIYLDLNNSWTKKEYIDLLNVTRSKNVFAFEDKLVRITDENKEEIFESLTKQNFSLFPLYEIKSPANSLLITKGSLASPNLSDISGSAFSARLKDYLLSKSHLKVYNLNSDLSPYLKTLKEFRAFDYDQGNFGTLSNLIKENKFVSNPEDSSTVVIHNASIVLKEKKGQTQSNAPDHLMRLFAYNSVMSQTGVNYLKADFSDSTLVAKAYKAYVVSPSTSLIVLETQEDYKRFGIQDGGTSLKNASMKSAGAVPEPHEWLLILVMAGLVIFLYLKSRN